MQLSQVIKGSTSKQQSATLPFLGHVFLSPVSSSVFMDPLPTHLTCQPRTSLLHFATSVPCHPESKVPTSFLGDSAATLRCPGLQYFSDNEPVFGSLPFYDRAESSSNYTILPFPKVNLPRTSKLPHRSAHFAELPNQCNCDI